jgi:hypothetical protein
VSDIALRKRNRRLLSVLIAVMLAMAVWGTLYLHYYGFNFDKTTERYH